MDFTSPSNPSDLKEEEITQTKLTLIARAAAAEKAKENLEKQLLVALEALTYCQGDSAVAMRALDTIEAMRASGATIVRALWGLCNDPYRRR